MKKIIQKIIPNILLEKRRYLKEKRMLKGWEKKGKPAPTPHRIKQLAIEEYQKKYEISVLIETGTYLGDMVKSQLNNFAAIYSIELGKDLWINAVKRFEKEKHVKIFLGDSGKVLKDLVPIINERAIFWLDGHYSGGITVKGNKECPIFEELNEILNSNLKHIILIDDARCFNGTGDYPSIESLIEFISSKHEIESEIIDDITRIILK